MIFKVQFS